MPSSPGMEHPEVGGGAGSVQWQRARLVLDQHQRGVDVGPVGRVLPVRAELAQLLPYRGLRRGSTVVVRGSTTVLLALLAQATAEGSWAGVVGMPDLGLVAAAELGVAVSRLALVPRPGAEFGAVVGALLDGVDLVAVVHSGASAVGGAAAGLARRLSARARHRESVLVSFGAWPGADLELDCDQASWSGLGDGAGHLVERELTVTVRGRGAATRPIRGRVTLPAGPGGPGGAGTRPGMQRPRPVAVPAAGLAPARPTLVPQPSARLSAAPHQPVGNAPDGGQLPAGQALSGAHTPAGHTPAACSAGAHMPAGYALDGRQTPAAHTPAACSAGAAWPTRLGALPGPRGTNPPPAPSHTLADHNPAAFDSPGFDPAGFDPVESESAVFESAVFESAEFEPAQFESAGLGPAGFGRPQPVLHIMEAG
ncbi:MAG TPA: hypothetical protein VFX70_05850 [Mycobacteriales bacterium]|nr:hypothetical protein [Mycobacteriales bacterium]